MKKLSFIIAFVGLALVVVLLSHKEDKRAAQAAYILDEMQGYSAVLDHEKAGGGKVFGMPNAASLQEYYQLMDPVQKRVPQERLQQANAQMRKLMQSPKGNDSFDITWEIVPSDMGGRTKALMWDPNTTNKVWAGAATGGIWYNNDITSSTSEWHAVNDYLPSLAISSFCYDPNNTQTYYAGTGEAATAIITYRESSGRGVGLYKSTDAGSTWSLMPSTANFPYITDVEVRNEGGSSVLYVAVVSGKYKGQDYTTDAEAGLYRSADGGATWEQVLPNITGESVPYAPTSIEMAADGRIFVGTTRNIAGKGGATILYSDAGTAGSWTVYDDIKTQIEASTGQYKLAGRVMISAAPSDANIVYAIIGAGYIGDDSFPYYKGNFVLKSTDKGATWTTLNLPGGDASWASLSWHAFSIDVDPNDPNHFYVGGLDEYHTKDGGTSYYHVSDWAKMYYGGGDDYIHADQHCIRFKPGTSNEAIFATDGGVFYTANATQNYPVFAQHNHLYSSLQYYACAIHPSEEQYLGALQDNGTLWYHQSQPLTINDMVHGGDGAACFFYQDNPDYQITSHYYNAYEVLYKGNNYTSFSGGTGTFVSPAALSSQTNTLYSNAVGFMGNNANKLWVMTYLGASERMLTVGSTGTAWFTHVAASPHTAQGHDNLFVGNLVGKLYKVEEAQASSPTTTEIGSASFPTAAISGIAIGGSEDTLLVTFSNYGVSSVWQTYDGGSSWQEKEGNLPDMPVRWALYHPTNAKQAMIATELGVWACADLSVANPQWQPIANGMANVRVDMLQMRQSDAKVLAASHGRGLFTTSFSALYDGVEDNEMASIQVQLYPNPNTGVFTISSPVGTGEIRIFDLQGKQQKNISIRAQQQQIDVSDMAAGIYMLNIYTKGATVHSQKLIIQAL